MEIAMMKILNNCISGRLNNNYFPLNENFLSFKLLVEVGTSTNNVLFIQ